MYIYIYIYIYIYTSGKQAAEYRIRGWRAASAPNQGVEALVSIAPVYMYVAVCV